MPALALKALRVLLEYGALLWLAYAVLRLGRSMFRTLHRDMKEAARLPDADYALGGIKLGDSADL